MTAVRHIKFAGIRPAVSDRLLPAPHGTVAHNTELRKGYIKPYMQPKEVRAIPVGGDGASSLYIAPDTSECCGKLFRWNECVDAHPVEIPNCAGFGLITVFPRRRSETAYRLDPCSGQQWPLVVPPPADQLTVTAAASAVAGKKYVGPDERSYTYTWVDIFGVESPPAPPSASQKLFDDQHATLAGFSTPPPNAVAVRIYRTGSQLQSGKNIDMRFSETFQLVEELDVSATAPIVSYTDTRMLLELDYGTLLTSEDCPPPAGMEATVEMKHGYLAGFKGNRVMFSQRYEYWNWPSDSVMEFPERVVAIAAHKDTLVVGTTGKTYQVKVTPATEQLLTDTTFTTNLDAFSSEAVYPALSQDTMTSTSFGVVYVSERGLIVVQPGSSTLANVSRERVDEDEWVHYAPSLLVWANGRLYGSRAHGASFIYDIHAGNEGKPDLGDMVTVDLPAKALHFGGDGTLYYSDMQNNVWAFDKGEQPMTYTWRSKKITTDGLTAYSAAKVVADYGRELKFTFYRLRDDGVMHPVYTRAVDHGKPFRIPHHGRGLVWQFEVSGTTPVHEVHVAKSIVELVERAETT